MQEIDATQTQVMSPREKFNAILRLTRWRDHVPFVVPLSLLGVLMALYTRDVQPDLRLLLVVLGNVLTMSAAFVINDVADAPDDARDPRKRKSNVIASGLLDRRTGLTVFGGLATVAFVMFAFSGLWPLIWGSSALFLAYAYSAPPFRFKALPVVDVVVHAYGGGSFLVITGYFLYSSVPGTAWLIILAFFLGSAYGQFYNQLDDYDVDKQADLHNTTQTVGKAVATTLMYLSLTLAIAFVGIAIAQGVFPGWLSAVLVVCVLACSMFSWKTDMRGNEASGIHALQVPLLLSFNFVTFLWLASAMGLLTGAG